VYKNNFSKNNTLIAERIYDYIDLDPTVCLELWYYGEMKLN